MKRDKSGFDEFQDLYGRVRSQTTLLFAEFDASIMPALRDTNLHPVHCTDIGCVSLAELFNNDTERTRFHAHNSAKLEWEQRSNDLLRQHHDMYNECRRVLDRGQALALDLTTPQAESSAVVERVQAILTCPLLDQPRDLESDLKQLLEADTKSTNILNSCKSAQIELFKKACQLLFEVMQLQSLVCL
eukprot:c12468_g1_i1.p1 GENE.c12468_g1_i1~~c12468_g1_i1.p1  ORF type:complete len:221 (-),score=71.50 c12468_g1_i1:57-620(-)